MGNTLASCSPCLGGLCLAAAAHDGCDHRPQPSPDVNGYVCTCVRSYIAAFIVIIFMCCHAQLQVNDPGSSSAETA